MIKEENKYVLRYQTPSIFIEISITYKGESKDTKRGILSLMEILDREVKEFFKSRSKNEIKEILNE